MGSDDRLGPLVGCSSVCFILSGERGIPGLEGRPGRPGRDA